MSLLKTSKETRLEKLQNKLEFYEKLKHVTNKINSAKNVDEILIDLNKDIQRLFNADRLTIYAVDTLHNELYSRYMIGAELNESRLPIYPSSLSGYSAYTLDTININDVYNEMELKEINVELNFDKSRDERPDTEPDKFLSLLCASTTSC